MTHFITASHLLRDTKLPYVTTIQKFKFLMILSCMKCKFWWRGINKAAKKSQFNFVSLKMLSRAAKMNERRLFVCKLSVLDVSWPQQKQKLLKKSSCTHVFWVLISFCRLSWASVSVDVRSHLLAPNIIPCLLSCCCCLSFQAKETFHLLLHASFVEVCNEKSLKRGIFMAAWGLLFGVLKCKFHLKLLYDFTANVEVKLFLQNAISNFSIYWDVFYTSQCITFIANIVAKSAVKYSTEDGMHAKLQ